MIALSAQPAQFAAPDPNAQTNQLLKILQAGNLLDESSMNRMKADEYRRGITDTTALNDAYRGAMGSDGNLDRNKLFTTLAGGGQGSKIPSLQKSLADTDKAVADVGKTRAETDSKSMETASKRVDSWGQAMGWLRQNPTPENAQAAVQHLVTLGVMPANMAQSALASVQANPSPQGIAQFADMGFRTALQAKDQLAKYDTRNTGGATDTLAIDPVTGQTRVVNSVHNSQSPDNAASVAATMRGQNMTDARAREANSAGRVPAGYRQKADGSLEFIPGGPADPSAAKKAAPTEFQGKAGMFGTRAQEADKIISNLEGQYSPSGINAKQSVGHTPLVGGALEAGSNMLLSDASQKAEQAQRDFVNAVLRLESGAAIGKDEFDNARKQYFRQPGDSQAVIAQKAQNRKTAIQGLMSNARPGGMEPFGGASVSGGSSPDIDALVKKYGGK